MIQRFIDKFELNKDKLKEKYSQTHPPTYKNIVKDIVEILGVKNDGCYEDLPDAKRITEIDEGDYQGTLVYVIGAQGYQPSTYWYTMVSYGSCSGCDTLQGISGYSDKAPTEQQTADYLTLALHIVQNIRKMYPDKGLLEWA